jgi:hypothetical protein
MASRSLVGELHPLAVDTAEALDHQPRGRERVLAAWVAVDEVVPAAVELR